MINFSRTSPQQHQIVRVFFAAVFVLGMLIFRSFGISVDENQQRDTGMISLKYVALKIAPDWVAADPDFKKYNVPLAEYYDRDYGVAFETPVALLERLLQFEDVRQKFLFRHWCTFLVCFGGLMALYQLAARRFGDWRLGLLAALWLLLTPRLFAESFYNNKDAVFMSLFAIATNTGVRLLLRPTGRRAAWHALTCALAIDVRIMAVMIPAATVGLLMWRGLHGEVTWGRIARIVVWYCSLLWGLVIALWPYLWAAPLTNLSTAFHNMSAFRWGGLVLYMGNMILATDIPWHYSLVWIGITTPIAYLAAGLLGLGLVMRQIIQQRWRLWADEGQLQDLLFLGLCLGPILTVIVLKSVLYDGWRQLYFIYPAFVLLAVRGWVAAEHWRPRLVKWLTVANTVVIAGQMLLLHPLQMLYFNILAGPDVAERYEMDYWGVGYQQDLAYIATHDDRPAITVVSIPPSPAPISVQMLPDDQRRRITVVESLTDSADYFITNYRWHPQPYSYLPDAEIYQLRADGRRVHSIFQLHW